MDCRYCHSFVEVAAHSNVPTTQVCMNCHSQVQKDNPKLAPVRESWATGKPIEWVQIHKTPDYVYFNHSAHVNRGVSCVSCHGEVDKMAVVYHAEPHSMAWCLDCHRNPENCAAAARSGDESRLEAVRGTIANPSTERARADRRLRAGRSRSWHHQSAGQQLRRLSSMSNAFFQHPEEPATGKKYWRSPRPAPRHAGVPRLARARVSARRLGVQRRRGFAPQFPATDGRVDGARRPELRRLPPAGEASRAVHARRRVVDSGQGALFRDIDADAPRLRAAGRDDVRWAPDEDRRQSAAPGEQRRDGLPGRRRRCSISTIRIARGTSCSRARRRRRAAFEKALDELIADGGRWRRTRLSSREAIRRRRASGCAARLRRNSRRRSGQSTSRSRTEVGGVFGGGVMAVPQLEKADVILSLDARFPRAVMASLADQRAFAARRKVDGGRRR